jgi:hypothetical protein
MESNSRAAREAAARNCDITQKRTDQAGAEGAKSKDDWTPKSAGQGKKKRTSTSELSKKSLSRFQGEEKREWNIFRGKVEEMGG